MKKVLVILYIVIVSFAFSEMINTTQYKKDSILGKEVYFPKNNSEYLEVLLKKNETESYYELALTYAKLDRPKTSKIYLKKYLEAKRGEVNYLKISKIYNIIGEYKNEIKIIEKSLDKVSLDKKESIYKYLRYLVEKKNLTGNESQYSLSKLERLKLLLNKKDYFEFYTYFNRNSWSEDEIKEIKKEVLNLDLNNQSNFKEFYFTIATPYEKLDYEYNNIFGIEDEDGFYNYFKKAKELGIKLNLKDDFESLYYYKWSSKLEEFKKLYNELLNRYINEKNYDALYKLYTIEANTKLLYNLALDNEEYLFEFIETKFQNEDLREILISEFQEKYPDGKNIWKLKKKMYLLNRSYMGNNEESQKIKELLEIKFDEDLFDRKMDILSESNLQEYEKELENYIFEVYPEKKYVDEYINLLAKKGETDKLYSQLENIPDKNLLYRFCNNYGYKIPEKYKNRRSYIEYLLSENRYSELVEHSDKLTYEDYKKLVKEGRNEFVEYAKENYPLKKEFMDLENLKYFYFGDIMSYNINIEELLSESNKTDAETYYLFKYYKELGEKEKAKEYLDKIYEEYKWNDKMKLGGMDEDKNS